MTARDVYFSAHWVQDWFPDPLIEKREKQIKVALLKECFWQQLMIYLTEVRETRLVPPELKNKHRMRSFFSPKVSIFRVKNLKFSFMGASPFFKTLIIRQISHYLPD